MSRHITGSGKFVDVVSGKADTVDPAATKTSAFRLSQTKTEPTGALGPTVQPTIYKYDPCHEEKDKDGQMQDEGLKKDIIPEMPENPDNRPKLIQYAEEYFGKYWYVAFAIIILLLFRKK